MTRQEFEHLFDDAHASLPIMMADGHMGLCNHWNNEHVRVDVYHGNDSHEVKVPWEHIHHISGGALIQVPV